MHNSGLLGLLFSAAALIPAVCANQMSYRSAFYPREVSIFDNRPDDCPPCFNCNLDSFPCMQYGNCTKASGHCHCPTGFGAEDCSVPLCGSPVDEKAREPRGSDSETCTCDKGWDGIVCNVCQTNDACNGLMPEGKDGICYKQGLVQKENHQMCDVANQKIVDALDPEKPQATFACNRERADCNFQFWVDKKESFYCGLDTCEFGIENEPQRNTTTYTCESMYCSCIPGRKLCGQDGFIDLGDFLKESIRGPATFKTISTEGGSPEDGSTFSEPQMDGLIAQFFGDESIYINCDAGECLYKLDVPGYARPIKKINTPLIAGVIAGCALFIVACILTVWYLSRRSTIKQYGPLYVQDPDDENARLIADHKPTALHFQNVGYRLSGKQILSGVQGAVRPGEVLAIMGGSGAGKTTFLDILARKNKKGTSEGQFYINGEHLADSDFRNVIGFVDQDDTMLATLTVHETILDSALLRLPRDMLRSAKEQRVEEVEKQLGIFAIRDQLIGSEEGSGRGISGGEKRRVGIACELVTSPSILFLDEPTSGLDAYNAFNVIECLVNLVKSYNRTVVFTIHQPRSNIVALFDQLILLSKGRSVYSGPFSSCQSYFDSIGYSCPPGFNIADYLVDLTMHASQGRTDLDDLVAGERNGDQTRSSSMLAVKSIASISGISTGPGQTGNSSSNRRPANERRMSIKQKQDEQLYGRPSIERTSTDIKSPRTRISEESEAVPLDEERESSQAWLQQKQGLLAEDPINGIDHPPADANTTGTDLDYLITSYQASDVATSLRDETKNLVSSASRANGANGAMLNGKGSAPIKIKGYRKVGLLGQFSIISVRIWRNLYRNPMLLLTHYAISIVLAVVLGTLYYGLTDDLPGFQNRLGLLFFILALFGFSTLTSLTVFAAERLLFVRERAKGYYHPIAYFAAKVIFDVIPLRLIPPIILGVIVYPMTGLVPAWAQFWRFMMFLVLFNFAAAAICLFIGIVFKNPGVANLIGSLTILFSLLFAGFLLNHDKIPKAVVWLQKLSIFHYGFEGLIVNEVKRLSLIDHKYGIDIEVPGAAILSSFGFDNKGLTGDAIGLAVFTGAFVIIAYLSMHLLLVERR